MTYLILIEQTRIDYDLNKTLGTFTKSILITQMGEEYEHPTLKTELKKCTNFNQMINVIEQMTGELSKTRTQAQLNKFQNTVDRIVKMARL